MALACSQGAQSRVRREQFPWHQLGDKDRTTKPGCTRAGSPWNPPNPPTLSSCSWQEHEGTCAQSQSAQHESVQVIQHTSAAQQGILLPLAAHTFPPDCPPRHCWLSSRELQQGSTEEYLLETPSWALHTSFHNWNSNTTSLPPDFSNLALTGSWEQEWALAALHLWWLCTSGIISGCF